MARTRRATNQKQSGIGCLVLLGLLLIGGVMKLAGCSSTSTPSTPSSLYGSITTSVSYPSVTYAPPSFTYQPVPEPMLDPPSPAPAQTEAPAGPVAPYDPAPNNAPDVVPGDTAMCNDGTLYHGSHRGACSHHHGVARWL